jgi:hypothetical protein
MMPSLFFVALARAGSPVEAEVEPAFPSSPPLSIDDAETVEKGGWELNLTAGFAGKGREWEAEAPLVDANVGITDNIHVNAEIPFVVQADESGMDTGLGRGAVAVKLRLLHKRRLQLAIHPAVELPPLPKVSVDNSGGPTVTLPAVLDVALGQSGVGLGLQLARSFTGARGEDAWSACVGLASPLGSNSVLMVDYAQDLSVRGRFGEGWFELGYVGGQLFGSDHLTLLSSVGRSTAGDSRAQLGIQVSG